MFEIEEKQLNLLSKKALDRKTTKIYVNANNEKQIECVFEEASNHVNKPSNPKVGDRNDARAAGAPGRCARRGHPQRTSDPSPRSCSWTN